MSRRGSRIDYTTHMYSIQVHTSVRSRKHSKRAGRRRLIGLALPPGPRGVGRGRAGTPPAAHRCALANDPRAARAWGARRRLRGPRHPGGRARQFPWRRRALARPRRDARPRRLALEQLPMLASCGPPTVPPRITPARSRPEMVAWVASAVWPTPTRKARCRCAFAAELSPAGPLGTPRAAPGVHSRGSCGTIAFAFPIRYTTQPGYGIHGMPDNPDTPVQLQRVGGLFQGGYGARIPGTRTPRAGKRREKDRSHWDRHAIAVWHA